MEVYPSSSWLSEAAFWDCKHTVLIYVNVYIIHQGTQEWRRIHVVLLSINGYSCKLANGNQELEHSEQLPLHILSPRKELKHFAHDQIEQLDYDEYELPVH